MAEYIKTLKEDNGDITYPVTQAGAVLLSGGGDLETTLNAKASQTAVDGKIDIGDVQSSDIVSNAVTTTKIADGNVTTAKVANGAITTDKIDWSTTRTTGSGWHRIDFGTLHILCKSQGFTNLSKSWQTIGTVPSDLIGGQLVFFRWTGVFGNSGNCLSYSAQMNSSGVIQAQIDSPSGNNGGWSFAVILK